MFYFFIFNFFFLGGGNFQTWVWPPRSWHHSEQQLLTYMRGYLKNIVVPILPLNSCARTETASGISLNLQTRSTQLLPDHYHQKRLTNSQYLFVDMKLGLYRTDHHPNVWRGEVTSRPFTAWYNTPVVWCTQGISPARHSWENIWVRRDFRSLCHCDLSST